MQFKRLSVGKTLEQLGLTDEPLRRSRIEQQRRQKKSMTATGPNKRVRRPAHARADDPTRSETLRLRPFGNNQAHDETVSNGSHVGPIAMIRSVDVSVAQRRPVIPAVTLTIILYMQDLVALSERAWSALARSNQPAAFFQHAETLVRIEVRSRDGQLIRPLDRDRLRYLISRVSRSGGFHRAKANARAIPLRHHGTSFETCWLARIHQSQP